MSYERVFNKDFFRAASEYLNRSTKTRSITPEERLERLVERNKNVKLLDCPFCGGYSKLKFFLHIYGGDSGMAGAYHISVAPACICCGAGFEEVSVFTNVTAPDKEIMSEDETDKFVAEVVKKWNRRCDKIG